MAVVLFVDDDPDLRDGMRLNLRREAHQVLDAGSAVEGLALLGQHPVDVLISDEHMPGTLGTDFLAQVARDYPAVVRILLTGRADTQTAIKAINQGRVFRFLEKPYRHDALVALLGEAEAERADLLARERGENADPLSGLAEDEASQLSTREREVVVLLAGGRRVQQIAKRLFISPHTVRNHLRSVFQKLQVHSQQELLDRLRPAES